MPAIGSSPAPSPTKWSPAVLIASGVVLVALIGALTHADTWSDVGARQRDWLFAAIYLAAGLVLLVTVRDVPAGGAPRWVIGWVLVAGLAMRLLACTQPPVRETDYQRYLWDGAVTAHGQNPYRIPPADAPGDPRLAELAAAGQPVLDRVGHAHLVTIYPPIAQAVFAIAYRLAPFSVQTLRGAFLFFDLAVLGLVVLLLRRLGRPLLSAVIYWWNPIVVNEFYLAVHMDAVVIAFTMAAVAAAVWRWRHVAPALLGLAVGAKVWPVVLAPVLVRRLGQSWRGALKVGLLFAVVAAVVLWPLLASWRLGEAAGLHSYAHHWRNNAGLFNLLRWAAHRLRERGWFDWAAAENAARLAAGGLLVFWLALLSWRPSATDEDFVRRGAWAVAGLFLLSPTQFPWYYTWLLPLLAVTPSWPLLWYTALLPLYHLHYTYPWVLWVEHLPVWLMVLWTAGRWVVEHRRGSW